MAKLLWSECTMIWRNSNGVMIQRVCVRKLSADAEGSVYSSMRFRSTAGAYFASQSHTSQQLNIIVLLPQVQEVNLGPFRSSWIQRLVECSDADMFMRHLKGGGEKMSEDEVDAQLDKVLRLLTYISDKDLFNEFYKKKLGRRLLNDNNTQDDAERSALSKLKQQFGTQFTSKVGIFCLVNPFLLSPHRPQTRFIRRPSPLTVSSPVLWSLNRKQSCHFSKPISDRKQAR